MDAIGSLGIDWRALVAQAVNFTLLLLILRYFLYSPIVEMLDKRRDTIQKGLKEAEEAEKKLSDADKISREKIDQANLKAQKIIKLAKEESSEEASQTISEAKEKGKQIIQDAKEQAEIEKNNIVSKARADLGKIVVIATEKIIEQKPEADEIEKMLQKVK